MKKKVIKTTLSLILSFILVLSIILSFTMNLIKDTVLNEGYMLYKLNEIDYYSNVDKKLQSGFEGYIEQSGFDNTIVSQIFISLTASIGNMLVVETKEKSLEIFNKIEFMNFWLFCFCSICICFLVVPFITLWIGIEYILSNIVLIVLVINFYMQGMRRNINVFKEAAGIYYEDRFIALIEALINLIASLILVKLYGLVGVFMGTILSTLILFLYSYPKYVYNKLFDRPRKEYILLFFKYLVIFIINLVLTYGIIHFVRLDSPLLQLIVNGVICLIVPNLMLYIIFRNTNEFKYFVELFKSIKGKILKRIKKVTVIEEDLNETFEN